MIRRATHRNTSWDVARFEVAAHRFADLSEQGYGVALLNDGKYGHHALGNELGLSLLRSPVYPDPLADEGRQSFTYALYPHAGDWLTGGVLAEAEDLNRPLLAKPSPPPPKRAGPPSPSRAFPSASAASSPPRTAARSSCAPTSPPAPAAPSTVGLPDGWRLGDEVNLLEDRGGAAELTFLPFQLHSWTIEKS